jgi:hypothetical protein
MRVLSCVVIVSAAITVWTRAALVFALGPQLTSACLWIAGAAACARSSPLPGRGSRAGGRDHRGRPPDMPRVVTVAGRARPGPPANPAGDATAPADRRCGSRVGRELFSTRPGPGAGEVLIRAAAFGLNHAEAYVRSGAWGEVAQVPGIECAGTVQADPGGRLAAGTAVVAILGGMGRTRNGSYAELVTVPASNVVPVRTSLPWTDLVALADAVLCADGPVLTRSRRIGDQDGRWRTGTATAQ